MEVPFKQVDVFTDRPFLGNPVAVVLDARGLDTAAMQTIARWTNLSETTFVLPATVPDADYRLRIFTPHAELPFAGHPTLGSAHAIREAARAGQAPCGLRAALGEAAGLTQQCTAGLIRIGADGADGLLRLSMPEARIASLPDVGHAALSAALGSVPLAPAQRVDVGAVWIVAELDDPSVLLALEPELGAVAELSRTYAATGVTLYAHGATGGTPIEVRSFAPAHGIDEDPVCGSGNGSVAHVLRAAGHRDAYRARQGRAIGRDGWIHVDLGGPTPTVGGHCVTCVDGTLRG